MKTKNFDNYQWGTKRLDDTTLVFTDFDSRAGIQRTSKNRYEFVAVTSWKIYCLSFSTFQAVWDYVWNEFAAEYRNHKANV